VGRLAARLGEKMRQGLDLEHWAAFGDSLRDLEDLLERVAAGRHGDGAGERRAPVRRRPPRLSRARRVRVGQRRPRARSTRRSCSPMRNPLDSHERRGIRIGHVARRGA
jgi:hypothetical protein